VFFLFTFFTTTVILIITVIIIIIIFMHVYSLLGWINPQNIQKYRSGVHISMVQYDKPSGRGNSGVHLDLKEKDSTSVTSANLQAIRHNGTGIGASADGSGSVTASGTVSVVTDAGRGGKYKGTDASDTKSLTSRQSNYKTNPTDSMRSMSSMMMMGKNTITTTVPLDGWKNLKYSKTNSQTFFSTPGKSVKSEDLRSNGNQSNTEIDGVENAVNNTQHLTISNNNKRPKGDRNEKSERYCMKSACVTTDFSMQNVLMQMGLNVISVDGMLIR
jgi:hypothetical protein